MTGLRSLLRPAVDAGHRAVDFGSIAGGLYRYHRSGIGSPEARLHMLNLHCASNGRVTDGIATLLRRMRPPRQPAPATGVLGEISVAEQEAIVRQIARDGYYVFERRLSSDDCDEIERFAAATPCLVEGKSADPSDRVILDPAAPISKTYRLVEQDIVRNPPMQRLMADPSLLAVAERYLAMHPSLVSIHLWWSPVFGDQPGSAAAQEFHFDFDPPPVWLLIFVYLTDVGPENGPHVYVRGSHKAGHPAADRLLKRGYVRISDEDIAGAFGAENVVELPGQRGTILAVDTRGFHKGKMPTKGCRLMAQLTYASPLFVTGGPPVPLPAALEPELATAIATNPDVYGHFR